ncbi:hypothetical protein NQ317_016223 [Molorchus minor]|uniref:peptide-methionine (S)-S-oxide reductase n=1 Tax=Molorchus minor TaxID=1323400 RepID=A0ABQ9IW99_9CUCU|nr:hypothetical protein NQ317_016223 [Molorchus minor]
MITVDMKKSNQFCFVIPDNGQARRKNTKGDHTEVIEIDYDPKIIGYEDLLELFGTIMNTD